MPKDNQHLEPAFQLLNQQGFWPALLVGFLLQIYGTNVWAMIVQSYANAERARAEYNLSLQFYPLLPSIAEHLPMRQSHEDSSLVIVISSWNSY